MQIAILQFNAAGTPYLFRVQCDAVKDNSASMLYQSAVEDPSKYGQPWKGEMPLNISNGPCEYACHEGNYGMFNLPPGACAFEREGRKSGVRKQSFAGVPE